MTVYFVPFSKDPTVCLCGEGGAAV